MDNAYAIPGLLLGVLGLPLFGALVAWLAGRTRGPQAARKAAAYMAAAHVILTAVFIALAVGTIEAPLDPTVTRGFHTFEPRGVPGDPGLSSGAPLNTTTWAILPIKGSTAVQFFVGVDGLNIWLIALTSLMTFLAVLVSWESVGERAGGFYCWLFLLQAACLGAFLSFDLLLFYIFFELTLIPAFFLIGCWGVGGGRRDAARKFFLYTLFGSLFTLVGLLGIAIANPTPLHPLTSERLHVGNTLPFLPKEGPITFSIPDLMENVQVWDNAHQAIVNRTRLAAEQGGLEAQKAAADAEATQRDRRTLAVWLFFALMAGFAVKVPIVPFHTWLPSAYGEAPLAVTMILSAVLAKLGTFGILRIVLPLAPEPAITYGLSVFGTLAAIGIVYAAFCAYAQKDLKLLAAYSSVSHLGLLVLALFALTPESLTGATLHMVNHGLTAGALFALLAFLMDRYRTTEVAHYNGLLARFPKYAFFFIVLSLAAVGLPGLNSFVSEMLMISGLFDPRNLKAEGFGLALAAASGIFLAAWYTFTMVRRVFFGPVREPATASVAKDVSPREFVTFSVLAGLCLALGIFAQPVLDTIARDVQRVSLAIEAARNRLDPGQRSPADYRREDVGLQKINLTTKAH